MKRLSNLFIGAAVLVALSGSSLVWAKAHVPLDKVQVCTEKGEVRNVSIKRLERELEKGGCRLTACDFAQIFVPKTDCDPTRKAAPNIGFCASVTIPLIDSAIGVTATCTPPLF